MKHYEAGEYAKAAQLLQAAALQNPVMARFIYFSPKLLRTPAE